MNPDYEQLEKEQRLKASLYRTVKKISKDVEREMDVNISPQVLATLTESLTRQAQCYALDLENFAKHARRTTVNVDDVKLVVRRNPFLVDHLTSETEQTGQVEKKSKKQTSKSTSNN